jgi:hypothetical protein
MHIVAATWNVNNSSPSPKSLEWLRELVELHAPGSKLGTSSLRPHTEWLRELVELHAPGSKVN